PSASWCPWACCWRSAPGGRRARGTGRSRWPDGACPVTWVASSRCCSGSIARCRGNAHASVRSDHPAVRHLRDELRQSLQDPVLLGTFAELHAEHLLRLGGPVLDQLAVARHELLLDVLPPRFAVGPVERGQGSV